MSTTTAHTYALLESHCDMELDGCNRIRIVALRDNKETKDFQIHIDTILEFDHNQGNVIDWLEEKEGFVLVNVPYLPIGKGKHKHIRTYNAKYAYTSFQDFIDARISREYSDWKEPVLEEIRSIWK